MTSAAKSPYAGYRFPGEIISHAVWLYFRFPLSLRMVDEMLAARGIVVSHETVRQWGRKFGQAFANQIRRRLPCPGDKWHLDEVCLMIGGQKHWLWRAVDQDGVVLDVLVQKRRDKRAAKRLLRKLLKKQGRTPRVMITDKLASLSVTMTRGGRICRFSSLRSRRLAACLSRRLWTRTSSMTPSWSTARQSQCFLPRIIRHTWRVARGSLTPTRSQNRT